MSMYKIIENGHDFEVIEAESAEQALEIVDAPDNGDYPSESTTWIEWHAVNVEDGDDSDYRTFKLDPAQPDCEGDHKHEWQDHEPAWGSGGGVKYSERCKHCGAIRHTDTWATNPSNGTQGHKSIRYSEEDAE